MDINDKIFEFAYKMAFRDSTMRNAFLRYDSEKNDDSAFSNRKNLIKEHSRGKVQEYIDKIISGNKPEPLVTIRDICDQYNTIREFTFGNAQNL